MEDQWNRSDCLYIVRHVIALFAIATGDGTHQFAILVSQRDGSTVILQLAADFKLLVQRFFYPFVKVGHFVFGIGVSQ